MSVLIVIPARLKATRLPDKPLAMIGDAPMIVQVWRRAIEAALGPVIVACDGEEIASIIRDAGGTAILTDPDCPSGSDRIWQALELYREGGPQSPYALLTPRASGSPWKATRELSPKEDLSPPSHAKRADLLPSGSPWEATQDILSGPEDIIINLQGDVPTLEPKLLHELLVPLQNPAVDIATLATEIRRTEENENPSVVKVVLSLPPGTGERTGRALYFTRATAPYGEGPRYHHIGVYAYRRAALARFVTLPPSPLEQREKLEQLRALEAGLRIDVRVVDTVPLGVDTAADLERARELLGVTA